MSVWLVILLVLGAVALIVFLIWIGALEFLCQACLAIISVFTDEEDDDHFGGGGFGGGGSSGSY